MEQNHFACLISSKVENKHQQLDDYHMVQNMTDTEKMLTQGSNMDCFSFWNDFVQRGCLISGSHLF